MRTGGLYSQLARRTLPGFMAVDQLRNQQDPNEFLCLTFWTSFDTYSAAQKSSNAAALAHFLSKLTIFSANLGVYFTSPDRLIPRFPGASLTQQIEQSSGDNVGLSADQGYAAGDSESNCQQ